LTDPTLTAARPATSLSPLASFVLTVVLGLAALRLVAAGLMPLANDEILYWRYSLHLGFGYLDHPALNPAMIWAGTHLFGHGPFGVRFMAIVASLIASWATWRAGAILLKDERAGLHAVLALNLTFAVSLGGLIATSDIVVLMTGALLLLALAKLNETQNGAWWLAVGAAVGLGMYAKYTTVILAFGIVGWMVLHPPLRRWFLTPWPWLGGALALAMFAPILWWNAERGWASFVYQSSRMGVHDIEPGFILEFIGSQFVLVTPAIAILAVLGFVFASRSGPKADGANLLLASQVAPLLGLFLLQSIHERVQGNWPMAVYPALAVAAAAGWRLAERDGAWAGLARWSGRIAAPFTIAITTLVLAQGAFGVLPLKRDPIARELTQGFDAVANEVDQLRTRTGAKVVLSSEYSTAVLLKYYGAPDGEYHQMSDRVRWSNEPAPAASLFDGPIIFVNRANVKMPARLAKRFGEVEKLATIRRTARGRDYETYEVWRVAEPIGPPLNPMLPIRRKDIEYDEL
jgi:4-amino-4-deoxy-L-arabinose transferase-like glycosyltransferase